MAAALAACTNRNTIWCKVSKVGKCTVITAHLRWVTQMQIILFQSIIYLIDIVKWDPVKLSGNWPLLGSSQVNDEQK